MTGLLLKSSADPANQLCGLLFYYYSVCIKEKQNRQQNNYEGYLQRNTAALLFMNVLTAFGDFNINYLSGIG